MTNLWLIKYSATFVINQISHSDDKPFINKISVINQVSQAIKF